MLVSIVVIVAAGEAFANLHAACWFLQTFDWIIVIIDDVVIIYTGRLIL